MRKDLICERTRWNSRKAYRLSNGLVQLVTLTGGGHIAEFQFERSTGLPELNPLWTPHWKSIEPYRYRPARHASQYGSLTEGKLLSGIAGHSICLDRFGPPSAEEVAQGLSFHGEAPNAKWRKTFVQVSSVQVALTLSVNLPVANLNFSREIKLRRNESVAYFSERVENPSKADRAFQWQQHVSLGPPFLHPTNCRVFLPATHGIIAPGGYDEGKALLAPGNEFRWPFAPLRDGGSVDLRRTLIRPGAGLCRRTANRQEKREWICSRAEHAAPPPLCILLPSQAVSLGGHLGRKPGGCRGTLEAARAGAGSRVRLDRTPPFTLSRFHDG
jgi:hypothetical protein